MDNWKIELDLETARHRKEIDRIANERLQAFRRKWTSTHSDPLELIFGNGTEFAKLNGKWWNSFDWDDILVTAIADVDEITAGHTQGCPDNLVIEP